MKGYIHSYQSMGTLDGPGIRFVVFLQGCPLRCGYCHNPDTWDKTKYKEIATPEEVVQKALKYKHYFGKDGGVTVSGGEALVQAEFVAEVFKLCKKEGVSTCLDTSGCLMNENITKVLKETDTVLLDIKMTTKKEYSEYIGASMDVVLKFLNELEQRKIPTWIRQVIVPGFNDCQDNALRLQSIIKQFSCVEKVEFLPFRKLCKEKYSKLGIPFPFDIYQEGTEEVVQKMNAYML